MQPYPAPGVAVCYAPSDRPPRRGPRMETAPACHICEQAEGPWEHAAYVSGEGGARRYVGWLCRYPDTRRDGYRQQRRSAARAAW